MATAPSRRRTTLRLGAGLAVAAVAVLLGATGASAHVHVDGEDATRGGYGVLTFRVPTESDTASTTEVSVTMPTRTPIASASVQPVAGWTATVTTARLAKPITTDDGRLTTYVARIDWKAEAGKGIRPGQFQQFLVSAGPLPDAEELAFPTLQTYSDGTRVNWNETASGGAEPEHPAPVLALAAPDDAQQASPQVSASAPAAAASADAGTATAGLVVGIGGVVLAAIAVILALVALLRGSKRSTGA
ncbi:hypothetical protein GCM10025783_25830 [Amnibacterium soli]|uniref:YncI copper-binding domain-containing protein n=1 Tax=Amnibacterium soli TaxID=1282736 RepID=A0ABP8ZBP3_9MICO